MKVERKRRNTMSKNTGVKASAGEWSGVDQGCAGFTLNNLQGVAFIVAQ